MADLGLPHWRQTVAPGRDNLVVRLEGSVPPERGGPMLLLEAHQDTVPVDGMTIEPFSPVVRQGRLFGRGSCDVKGGMTAILAAVARLAAERPAGMPTVYVAFTVNEEHGFSGAMALAALWKEGRAGTIFPRRPDAAIVAEPTELDVVVAHKGTVRWRCHARGRAAHSARPEQGDNAIYKMARAVGVLERYAGQTVGNLGSHPILGRPTLSVGRIEGGISVNTVPDRSTIEIDRRLVPGEVPLDAWRHAVEHVSGECPDTAIEHDPPFIQSLPLDDGANGALAADLGRVAAEVAGRGRRVGVPYGTDAAFYAAAGVPTVVFGPGSIAQAHTADEWVSLEQVQQAAEVLYCFVRAAK